MAETIVPAGLTPQVWDDQFFMEYVRENRFNPYMGTNENAIIHVKEDLTRKKGDKVTFAAVRALDGPGVTGNQVLEGNEEELDTRSMVVQVRPHRNAVVMTEWDEQKSAIDIRNAARTALKNWSLEKMRDQIIQAFMSKNGVAYGTATEAQKDAWLADNTDRALFGNARGNTVGSDHSASLANIDNTADKLTAATISLAKRMAQTASPAIRPMRIREGDQEWFLMFAHPLAFRDLQNDPVMAQANRDARERNVNTNPIFTGGALVYDGVIIREIPEIPSIPGGAGGIQVAPNFLVGAQAIGVAWARRLKSTTDVRDYGFRHGVGIQEIRGIEKLLFGKGIDDTEDLVDNGVVTVYTAAVPDA